MDNSGEGGAVTVPEVASTALARYPAWLHTG